MMNAFHAHPEVKTLLIHKLDRMHRKTVNQLNDMDTLGKMGIRLIAIADGVDTNDNSYHLIATIKAALAEQYSLNLASEVRKGLLTAAKVVLRLVVVCIPLALVLAVTRISDLTNALVKVLHLPYPYAFTLSTAIRFIPQFLEEMSGIMEAQTARGVAFDKARGLKKFSMILPLCAPLLISSVRRTDQTAVAAEVRGFRLRTRESGYKKYPFTAVDLGAVLFSLALLAGAILL